MQYFKIKFDAGVTLLQEIYDGEILRYCTDTGQTAEPPMGGAKFIGEVVPDFTLPPVPEPSEQPQPVPQSITRLQAKIALSQAGLLEQIQAMMAALPATDIQRLAWENALQFERHSGMVNAMAQALSISQEQLDALFIAAAGIEV